MFLQLTLEHDTGSMCRADSSTHPYSNGCPYLEIQRVYGHPIFTFGYPFGPFPSFHHQFIGCTGALVHSEARVLYSLFFTTRMRAWFIS